MKKFISAVLVVVLVLTVNVNLYNSDSIFADGTEKPTLIKRLTGNSLNSEVIPTYNDAIEEDDLTQTQINRIERSLPTQLSLVGTSTSSVKNQGSYGVCWAFAASASGESSLYNQNILPTTTSLSPRKLVHSSYNSTTWNFENPYNEGYYYNYDQGGNYMVVLNTLSKDKGIDLESRYPYSGLSNGISRVYASPDYTLKMLKMYAPPITHNFDAYGDPESNNPFNETNLLRIKQALNSDGALYMSYDSSVANYNAYNGWSTYNTSYQIGNHAVTIVGYDDDYALTNFSPLRPPSNGAFLIKNSWGPSWGNNGYFWLSYYDNTIDNEICYIELENKTNDYDKVNYLDDCGYATSFGWSSARTVNCSQIFKATTDSLKDEILKYVSFYSDEATQYTIKVYTNVSSSDPAKSGTLVLTQQDSLDFFGYHKIRLNKDIGIKNNTRYRVQISFNNVKQTLPCEYINDVDEDGEYTDYDWEYSNITMKRGESFYSTGTNPTTWSDLYDADEYNGNFSLNTYSKTVPLIKIKYTGKQYGGKKGKKNTKYISLKFAKAISGLKISHITIKNSSGKAQKLKIKKVNSKQYRLYIKGVKKTGYIYVYVKSFGQYKFPTRIKVKIYKR